MSKVRAVVVAYDLVTPYGWGIDACWQGLLSGKTAIKELNRFATESFQSHNAAIVPGLKPEVDESLLFQMLKPLLKEASGSIPEDAYLLLATATGEIEILEKSILYQRGDARGSRLDYLSGKVKRLAKLKNKSAVVSAACASSTAALAQAAAIIRGGEESCFLVVAGEEVSEFVFAGFSSLMALDRDMARPFDKNRSGLTPGEAAGFILLMDERRARQEKRRILGEIAGWGLSNDAHHMTAPDPEGKGLVLGIRKALRCAQIQKDKIGSIAAHGTGTVYNDAMEMKALKAVFGKPEVPTYSIKGGIGHTMGAAGLIEAIVAIKSLKEKVIPPTVNLRAVDEEASGWVFPQACRVESPITLSLNAGFGGINAVLVLKR